MTILVLFGSSHVGARIIHQLSAIDGVTVVEGGHETAESVHLIDAMKPDIVVLDAQLGGGAGIELLRRTKSLQWPPIVIMTAISPIAQYHRECMKEGADYFFHLPSEVENLRRTIVALKMRKTEPFEKGI
jgi:DNA-binding response OmpR family regulator